MNTTVNTSIPHIMLLRKKTTWYSIRDGDWTDSTTWLSNATMRRGALYPKVGDDVYVNHNVRIDSNFPIYPTSNYSINNLYVSGKLYWQSGLNKSLQIKGNLQVSGTLDLSISSCTVYLYGTDNFVSNFFVSNNGQIVYAREGEQDIMPLTYGLLTISGSGNKNITAPLTVNAQFTINGLSVLYNKSNSNNLLFAGPIIGLASSLPAGINNLVNAPIETKAGGQWDVRTNLLQMGTGTWTINGNQTLNPGGGTASGWNMYNNMLIKSGTTLTRGNDVTPIYVYGSIDGESSTSVFNNSGGLWQTSSIEPMANFGVYNHNSGGTSRIGYAFNGNYNLPHTSYNDLVLQGTGIKMLNGDTTIGRFLFLDAILELATYGLSINNTTTIGSTAPGTLQKSNTGGNVIFIGNVTCTSSSSYFKLNASGIVFEFRNGMTWDIRSLALVAVSGSMLKYSTNNQVINIGGGANTLIDADILISGGITITNTNFGFGTTGVINGNNALSKFYNQATFNYQNSQQPMQTGILDCSTSSNFWIYGGSANQDITPGTYQSLTLNNNGTKKLLGNVSVISSYILTPPANLNSNGYSLTNP